MLIFNQTHYKIAELTTWLEIWSKQFFFLTFALSHACALYNLLGVQFNWEYLKQNLKQNKFISPVIHLKFIWQTDYLVGIVGVGFFIIRKSNFDSDFIKQTLVNTNLISKMVNANHGRVLVRPQQFLSK